MGVVAHLVGVVSMDTTHAQQCIKRQIANKPVMKVRILK